MKTIRIYNEDAEKLERTAADQRMTASDLASIIFAEHFATTADDDAKADRGKCAPSVPAEDRSSIPLGPLMTTREIADHFRTSPSTVNQWYHQGFISAVVAEGNVMRFDLEHVCFSLMKRAREKQEDPNKHRVFMIPTL